MLDSKIFQNTDTNTKIYWQKKIGKNITLKKLRHGWCRVGEASTVSWDVKFIPTPE